MGNSYRTRIYDAYISSRPDVLAPTTVEGLKPRLPSLKKLIRQHFPPDLDASIIDLGCGHGALIHAAKQIGYRNITGVDGSLEQVAAAKVLGICDIEHADAVELLAEKCDLSLDCVVCFDLIEHFSKNELLPLADSVFRVLKPGGRWIIHTPNAESPFGMRSRYWDLTHELAFTRMSLSQLLLSSGFSEVDCYEDEPVVHGLKSAGRFLLWRCFRSLLRLYLAAETGDLGRKAIFSQNFTAVARKR